MEKIRKYVSKKKRRYTRNEFDLDLTYILPNLIAMGFPARNVQKVYRNNFDDFLRFLDENILKKQLQFYIYNLCPEDERKIYNNEDIRFCVSNNFATQDHNPPTFQSLVDFCRSASDKIAQERMTIFIHCKAGKGRTGVMVCALLLHCGRFCTAIDSMRFYAESRTLNDKGITIPSQRRYVEYYEYYLSKCEQYNRQYEIYLYGVLVEFNVLDEEKKLDFTEKDELELMIRNHNKERLLDATCHLNVQQMKMYGIIKLIAPLKCCGDIFCEIHCKKPLVNKEKFPQFWLNTFFMLRASPLTSKEQSCLGVLNDVHPNSLFRTCPNLCIQDHFKVLKLEKHELDKVHKYNSLYSISLLICKICKRSTSITMRKSE